MTYEEAKMQIQAIPGKIWDQLSEPDREAMEIAFSALEKAIPKKPIRVNKNEVFDGNWKKVCPLCGRILMERITTSERSYPRYYIYTGHCLCGQAIDWDS